MLTSVIKPSLSFRVFTHVFFKLNQYFIKNADGAIYVTEKSLQGKYPTNGFASYASDVEIDIKDKKIVLEDYNIHNRDFKIGLIGDYNNHYKGINEAIKAVEILNDQGLKINLHILGSGSLLKFYEDLAKELGVSGFVHFDSRLNSNDEVIAWLEDLDLYIQPSYTEGLPRALIEAMINGLPYAASNIDSIKETVLNLENLYDPKDIDSFVKAIDTSYKKRPQKDILHQQHVIEKFDANECFSRFYRRLSI